MLKGKDILNTAQFSLEELNLIMNTAASFEKQVKDENIIRNMEGKIVATLFLNQVPEPVFLSKLLLIGWVLE